MSQIQNYAQHVSTMLYYEGRKYASYVIRNILKNSVAVMNFHVNVFNLKTILF